MNILGLPLIPIKRIGSVWLWVAIVVRPCSAESFDPAAIDDFEREIRPLLVEKCYQCHGDIEQPKGGLKLTSRDSILTGGDSGPAAVPGKPDDSLLMDVVRYESSVQMPPKEKLSASSIDRLANWIKIGMPWPSPSSTTQVASALPSFGISPEQRAFWAFRPPHIDVLPTVVDAGWPRSDLDRFILAELERNGLSPAPRASKRVLLRRATYDLTGLPPTPEELQAFEADDGPNAFANVVDRLLASPAYGEHWGRHWLDVVRYADSRDARYVGAGHDITEAWRYRDWVIQAMNRDMPYDDFVLHQVAGDLLPPVAPDEINADGLIATGFLAIGEWGTGDSDAAKMHTDMVDDQINAVSRVFLGLTMGCARCHDHKFDPISTADYYALAGIFFSTQIATPQTSAQMVRVPLVPKAEVEKFNQYLARITEKEQGIKQFTDEQYQLLIRSRVHQTARYLMAAWDYRNRPPEKSEQTVVDMSHKCGLDGEVLGQWLDYLGWTPSNGKLLPAGLREFAGLSGVYAWKGEAATPVVVLNTNDQSVVVPGTLPPRSIAVHPSPTGGVAIGWHSAFSGRVTITGRVTDAHVGSGDGVEWRLEQCRSDGTLTLASGSIAEGGSQALATANSGDTGVTVDVQVGDTLRLVIGPQADYTCDMTTMEFEIRELGGDAKVWNVVHDLIGSPLEDGVGNPHSDRYGNRSTWNFYDCLSSNTVKSADRQSDSVLADWFTVTTLSSTKPDARAVVEVVANEVQRVLSDVANQPSSPSTDVAAVMPDGAGKAARLYQELISDQGPYRIVNRDNDKLLPPDVLLKLKSMGDEVETLKKNTPPPLPMALVARDGGVPGSKYAGFNDAQIHIRGRYDRLGDLVPRRFPEILAGTNQPRIAAGSGRLELGRWLASAENPLTSRVMVNRIWQYHFGTGLVRTPGNFGKLGERPTHPALLDYLTGRFIESGWSVKAMHRMIMLSAVYQQGATTGKESLRIDPDNRLFSRANIRRLEAESIRDTMLSVSEKLDRSMSGPSIRDGLSSHRAVYLMTIRSVKSGFPFLFDMADPEIVVDQRTTSTVAPQSLFLMNNEFILGLAASLAERIRRDAGDNELDQIQRAYSLLFGRVPTVQEVEMGRSFLDQVRKRLIAESQPILEPDRVSLQAWEAYCQALLCTNELIYLD